MVTENWSPQRLQARGRLPVGVRDLRIVILGVGALGSILADMLVRAGVNTLALVDSDSLRAGNICRHTGTLCDIDKAKVHVVAQRLRQVSPTVQVAEVRESLEGTPDSVADRLDEYDVIIDCTGSDEALAVLGAAWWPIPRIFASFSMSYGARRLFSFGSSGHCFPRGEFDKSVRPWLDHEAKIWAANGEVFEGAGCWSPIFPARDDDVALAAAICVKELEALVAKRPQAGRFRVYAQSICDDGFQGFSVEITPPGEEMVTP
ncbi:MAG: ThiF family adenylyltransferase [Planctomycetota bacterium]